MTAAPPAPAALLCPAVEDVTGFPCRRLACDGSPQRVRCRPVVGAPAQPSHRA
jgi:hypothetical protein